MASCVLLLVGCSNNANKSASADNQDLTVSYKNHFKKSSETNDGNKASEKGEQQESSSEKPSQKNSANTLWNADKDRQLEEFINNWAPKMNQTYQKFDGIHTLKNSVGARYPADLSQTMVNDESGLIGWSKDGNGAYEYNVVAIYNYNQTVPPLPARITYFFAFHRGHPVALVDESRDGPLRCFETKNQDVRNNFYRIANM